MPGKNITGEQRQKQIELETGVRRDRGMGTKRPQKKGKNSGRWVGVAPMLQCGSMGPTSRAFLKQGTW